MELEDIYSNRLKIIKSVEDDKWNALSNKLIRLINNTHKFRHAKRVSNISVSCKTTCTHGAPPYVKMSFDNGDYIIFDMFSAIESSSKKINLELCSIMYSSILFNGNEEYESELINELKQNTLK